mmetsp:Transcript_39604/g.38160  ORF Transcript_39604/g.38160 Transcript_39604/m.38160 type:complete len:88 (+) Transcript_39604:61-324(+)
MKSLGGEKTQLNQSVEEDGIEGEEEEVKEKWKPFHWADKAIDRGKARTVDGKGYIWGVHDRFIRDYHMGKGEADEEELAELMLDYQC